MDKNLEIQQLEAQISKLKAQNDDLRDKLAFGDNNNEYETEQKALSSIISTNSEVFRETYDLQDKQVEVVLHAPSIMEQGKIADILDRITKNKFIGYTNTARQLFTAVAYFRVIADKFPLDLTKLENTYNTPFIMEVWNDYYKWLKNYLTPEYDRKEHPDWNPNLAPAINKMGGLEYLVQSKSGRNIWAIMKLFKILPNDPLLEKLTYSQREFIIQSMNEDAKEAERAARGAEKTTQAEDKSFESKFYSNEEVDLLEDGDDLDDIYKQSLKIKSDVDAKEGKHEDYDKVIQERIEAAYQNKLMKQRNAQAQIDENWKNYLDKTKNYYNDEE